MKPHSTTPPSTTHPTHTKSPTSHGPHHHPSYEDQEPHPTTHKSSSFQSKSGTPQEIISSGPKSVTDIVYKGYTLQVKNMSKFIAKQPELLQKLPK